MFSYKFMTSLFVLSCALDSGLLKKLPEYIKVCKRDQETINECVPKSIEHLRPMLSVGIKELGVPAIDPMYIKKIVPVTDMLQMRLVGEDIKITGASNFTLKKFDIDLDTMVIQASLYFPKLHLEGRYKIDTSILGFPIRGEGTVTGDAIKCNGHGVIHGVITEKGGEEYLSFDKAAVDITIKDYFVRLDGLFKGDKVLGDAANQVINHNREEMLRIAKPHLESFINTMLLDRANSIVKDLTMNQIMPKP